jgi:hypothetical protein
MPGDTSSRSRPAEIDIMRLNSHALATSAAIVTGILSALCALAIAVAPTATMTVVGYVTHVDLSSVQRPLTAVSAVIGIIAWTIGVSLVALGFGRVYNWIVAARERRSPVASRRGVANPESTGR